MVTEAHRALIYRDYFGEEPVDVYKDELKPARQVAMGTDVIIFPRGSLRARPYHSRIVDVVETKQQNNPLIEIGGYNFIGGGTLVCPLEEEGTLQAEVITPTHPTALNLKKRREEAEAMARAHLSVIDGM